MNTRVCAKECSKCKIQLVLLSVIFTAMLMPAPVCYVCIGNLSKYDSKKKINSAVDKFS